VSLLFDVEQQVRDAKTRYAGMNPGRNLQPLWRSDRYSAPKASATQASMTVSALSDGEMYLLLGYTAIP
jgi:hypothetical protein